MDCKILQNNILKKQQSIKEKQKQLAKHELELKKTESMYKACMKKLKKKPTIAEMRAECKKQGLVFDTKTKKCREPLRGKKKAKPVAKPATKSATKSVAKSATKSVAKSATKPTPKPKPAPKPAPNPKPKGNKGKKQLDRRPLCPIPDGFKWDGRLGQTGKDGETWKVLDEKGNKYACKIFTATKSEKLIKKEINYQKQMGDSGVSPRVIWEGNKCFLMEMVNGPILSKAKIKKYTEKDVKDLVEIAYALAKAKIPYSDGNVKMNVMYDMDKNRWMLIDFGMVHAHSVMKKEAKQKKITIEKEYLLNAFNILIHVEILIMNKIYGKNFKYTPIGGGFVPKKSFPSIIHKLEELGLLELNSMFSIYKKTRERLGKYYDNSKMIGM